MAVVFIFPQYLVIPLKTVICRVELHIASGKTHLLLNFLNVIAVSTTTENPFTSIVFGCGQISWGKVRWRKRRFFFVIWANEPFESNSAFFVEGILHPDLSLSCPSCHDWDTLYSLYHQSHPASQPVLPFGLCHSEQPFVLSCPALLPQIEVVNTFKSGTSFQGAGALRRQSSTTSQTQDVTNVSSPSHVSLSNALSSPTSTTAATAPPTTGRESELCQSASLLSLLQGCHHVMNKKLLFSTHCQTNSCDSLHFGVGISEDSSFFFLSCSLLFSFPLSLLSFCCSYWISNSSWYLLPCLGVLSSHWWMCVCFLRVLGAQD